MEEQPSFESVTSPATATRRERAADFVRRVGKVLAVSLVASVLYALIVGPRSLVGFSDGLFFAGAILLIIGLLPLVSEIFSRSAVSLSSEDHSFEEILEQQRERAQRGGALTYLFGVSGIIVIVLSYFISFFVG
jgi:hypothetical protein